VNKTLEEASHCRRKRIAITTFMLAADPVLLDFVRKLTELNHGRIYETDPNNLGSYVFRDFVRKPAQAAALAARETTPAMTTPSPEKQLDDFIAKFTPNMARLIRAARRKMRKRMPQALELVYDNYNFFVIGYGPSEKASEAIFSLAAQAKGLSLCLLQGAGLPDPHGLLRGSGRVVRNIRLESAASLDRAEVRALIAAALEHAKVPIPRQGVHQLVIKSVSAKQRPRRPGGDVNQVVRLASCLRQTRRRSSSRRALPTTPLPTGVSLVAPALRYSRDWNRRWRITTNSRRRWPTC